MAYMTPRVQKCIKCHKKANQEVFNRVNASMGYFCYVCACREVARLEKAENAPN